MSTTVYIHIGLHKTGTTSIQDTLFAQRRTLLEHGINYLAIRANHSFDLMSLISETSHERMFNVRRDIDTPEKALSHNNAMRNRLTAEFAINKSPMFVISGEGLSGVTPEEVGRLKQLLDPYAGAYRIIVYVRDPYDYANSMLLQLLKNGRLFVDSGKRIPLPKYRKKIEKYIEAFGRQNVDIRVFNPARFVGGDLISDFLAALGAPTILKTRITPVTANTSMSHEAAILMSEMNVAFPSRIDGRWNPNRAGGWSDLMSEIEGVKFSMEPEQYLQSKVPIRRDLDWLHGQIGETVFPFREPPPASVPKWSEATVRSIKALIGNMALALRDLDVSPKPHQKATLPPELEWLRPAIETPERPATDQIGLEIPRLDEKTIRSLACLIHEMALPIWKSRTEKRANEAPKQMTPMNAATEA